MKKTLLFLPALLLAGLCSVAAQTPKPVEVRMESYETKKCVRTNACAEMSFHWPVLSGGSNDKAIRAINDSIRAFVCLVAEADPALPLRAALDSAAGASFAMLREQLATAEGYDAGYFNELNSAVLLNNGRYLSVSMGNFSYFGGAHPNTYLSMSTYDLATGKTVPLTDIIRDTAALRPMLEKAFIAEKTEEGEPAPKLSDLLFEDFKQLPMPMNYAVTPEGVSFYYNPYEVAAYYLGPTEITLTWSQLGKLADRKKWD